MSAALQDTTKPRPARGFVAFKWCVYAILAVDVVLYARFGRATELIDTAAWWLLLLLFEWETGGWRLPPRIRPALHGLRAVCAIAIAIAVGGYAIERAWLDFANESTWLAVIALLEVEVRLPPTAARLHRWRRRATVLLYILLAGFLGIWTADIFTGDDPGAAALDAWDAFWWLVAFLAVELNVFGVGRPRRA